MTDLKGEKVRGTVYFASDEAKRSRHLRDGQEVTLALAGRKALWLSEDFVQVDLSSTGRNYVHLSAASRVASSSTSAEQEASEPACAVCGSSADDCATTVYGCCKACEASGGCSHSVRPRSRPHGPVTATTGTASTGRTARPSIRPMARRETIVAETAKDRLRIDTSRPAFGGSEPEVWAVATLDDGSEIRMRNLGDRVEIRAWDLDENCNPPALVVTGVGPHVVDAVMLSAFALAAACFVHFVRQELS